MANFQKIKTIAKAKGVDLKNIADAVGISDVALSLIMRNNSTKTTTIESIAHYLEVPVGTFFDDPVITQDEQIKSGDIILTPEIQKMLAEKDAIIKALTEKICGIN